MEISQVECDHEEEERRKSRRRRYIPVRHLYYSSTQCVNASGSSNVMSKKVKARKTLTIEEDEGTREVNRDWMEKSLATYGRRGEKGKHLSFFEKLVQEEEEEEEGKKDGGLKEVKVEVVDTVDFSVEGTKRKRKRKGLKNELIGLAEGFGIVDVGRAGEGDGSGRHLRGSWGMVNGCGNGKLDTPSNDKKASPGPSKTKKWVELSYEEAEPLAFVGLQCKVFWPMDDAWYHGTVNGYSSESLQHQVQYKDGDSENLKLSKERIKFNISLAEMQNLNLKCSASDAERKTSNYDEMLALAASYDDCQDFEIGDIVWAKHTGYAVWPALVIDEKHVGALGVLKPHMKERVVSVQFFGTHDFARINIKQVRSFIRGLLSSFHLKCKQSRFERSLQEAKMYLSQQQLPNRMLDMQKAMGREDFRFTDKGERNGNVNDLSDDEGIQMGAAPSYTSPFEIGDLRVTSLGKIVFDSEHFHNKHFIWPEGYTASRKFMSITNPRESTLYKMEVLRNPQSKARPLFRITLDNGEKIEGPDPTFCWKEIYRRIESSISHNPNIIVRDKLQKSGSYMFGFSNASISQLIQDLPHSRSSSEIIENSLVLPSGYRAVRVEWKDIDRCNVCHMDEEYEDNLFLQCDKCRMMVHARCYGEIEPLDGVLWFCNLCRPGAPKSPPRCCLCPITGGAIKRTTDGRWAHLTCAMWIPETCLVDIKKMEPIDGLNRINKDRWKLLCSICGVAYGACIQCCNYNCYAAYHPLCARAAGLCVELETENQLHIASADEESDQCIRLISFCKKHRQSSNERLSSEEKPIESLHEHSAHISMSNDSGCARSEPYNFFGRRGQKEPQVLAAASTKRLYIENTPYLITGRHQISLGCSPSARSMSFSAIARQKLHQYDDPCSISSMGEKYQYMKTTCKKRLAFGKSRIHGFGVFAKIEHKAGDMVIEYAGEVVRPPVADIREQRIYNSLVGAGTYMFRIDDERVVDATRAGSLANLINHSCEPNCYSRTITVQGDEHIIIFAKRDITSWEELTYDYRFFSKDEQLSCFCGSSKCRGVVNDIETEDRIMKLWVPRCELIPWHEE